MTTSDPPLRILLIENSETDRIFIRRQLERALGKDCQITVTERLGGALNLLNSANIEHASFDAALLDMTLPDSVGPSACQKLRLAAPELPVLVLTGIDDEAIAVESLNQGAQDFLVKGRMDPRLLARSIRYAIERKRGEVDLQKARRRIQRQQHQAEIAHLARVNTMGEMASGMAHELNQPLTAIVGFAEAALAGFESGMLTGEENRLLLEKIVSESQRAAEIIRRLRRLVRKREPEQSPTDVNTLIAEVVEMVGHESEQGQHDVKLELDNDVPVTFADRVQVQQVLLNLVRNGMEAMEPLPVESRVLTIRSFVSDDAVHVSVSDNGPWVADEDLGKLFEPYFSTKKSGLGMGLAICRSIIEAHAGTLTASRNPDCGLNFEFTLPVRAVRNE